MARLLLSVASAEESHFACLSNCTAACWNAGCLPPPTPLPLLPNDPPPADDNSVSVGISHKHRIIQSFLIAAAALVAFSFFFLLLFYFLILRRRRRRRQAQQLAALNQHNIPPPPDPNADGLLDDDGGPHHVWYIRTVGLDDSVIKSIAATIYKAGDGLIDGGDCSVCLGEFRDGETVKLLPKCTHAFHLSCIDTWLRSHVNCPLCRAPVVAPPPPAAAEAVGLFPSPENAQIETENQEEYATAIAIAIDSAAAASSSSGPLDGDENGELQPIRRSVSMDSSSLGMLLLRAESESDAEEKLGEDKTQIELAARKNKGKRPIVECLGKQQQGAEMERSLSSMSGRLFLSRYGRGRGRSASVLPL